MCLCVLHMHTHAHTHTHAHNNFTQQGIRDTTAYWTPTIPCEHCHVLAHQIFTYSTGLLSEFLRFTNGN